jgi:clumping factor A
MGSAAQMRHLSVVAALVFFPLAVLSSDWPSSVSSLFSVDTSIPRIDTDRDGMPDVWENAHTLNPSVNDGALDPDGDGASNIQEYNRGTDPKVRDDLPRFALSSPFLFQLRPIIVDTDGDGMPDTWEIANGLSSSTNDAALDLDGDNLSNLQEYNGGWDPQVRELASFMVRLSASFLLDSGGPQFGLTLDTDSDGMPDWWEVQYGLNRLVNDSAGDPDIDDWSNLYEYQHGTNPKVNDVTGTHSLLSLRFLFDTAGRPLDTDGDGIPDFWEIAHQLNYLVRDATGDPDGDGRSNLDEYNSGTDPHVNDWRGPWIVASTRFVLDTGGFWGGYALDSDEDGMPDWWEIIHVLNPHLDDASLNPDGDNLTNIQEYNSGNDPQVNDWRGPGSTQSSRFSLYTIVDVDHDGIHDAWEVFYFGSKETCDPLGHGDDDGMNNYQEFVAGTDPKDSSSVLRFALCAEPAASAGVVFSWASASNTLYIIERATNLMSGFQASLESSVPATPPQNTYTDTTANVIGPYFYRIRVNYP